MLPRLVILIFSFLLPFGSLAASQDLQLFFIHGLGGDKDTFCDMPEALRLHFEKQGFSLNPIPLEYTTFDNFNDTTVFVNEIKKQILKHYHDNNLPFSTPYSFVVHSQGGIVGVKYLYRNVRLCYDDDPKEEVMLQANCEVPYNFQDFISFGTPFWGSQGANTSQNKLIDWAIKQFSGQYRQLEQLRIGSLSLGNSRRRMLERINFEDGSWTHPVRGSHQMKFHNLVGEITSYLDGIPFLHDYFLGGGDQEFDIIVSPSGGRVDFNYVVEKGLGEKAVEGKTNLGHSFYVAPIGHIGLHAFKFKNHFSGVDALKNMSCKEGTEVFDQTPDKHLAFHFAISVLDNYFNNRRDQPVELPSYSNPQGLNNFFVDMQIYTPIEMQRPPRIRQRDVTIESLEKEKIWKAVSKAGTLVRGIGFNQDAADALDNDKKYVSFFHDGRFANECCKWSPLSGKPLPTSRLKYTFDVPGFEVKEIEVPVEVAFSTFAKFYLTPYRPLTRNLEEGRFNRDSRGLFKKGDYLITMYNGHLGVTVDPLSHREDSGIQFYQLRRSQYEKISLDTKNIAEKCYVGLSAQSFDQTREKSRLLDATLTYNKVFAERPSGRIKSGVKLKILGRYYRKANHANTREDIDRYLVAIPRYNQNIIRDAKRYGPPLEHLQQSFKGITNANLDHLTEELTWIDVKDVDVLRDATCGDDF